MTTTYQLETTLDYMGEQHKVSGKVEVSVNAQKRHAGRGSVDEDLN